MRDRGAPGASVPQYRGTPGEGVFSSHQAVCAGGVSGSRRVRVSAFRRLPVPPKLAAIIGALRVDRLRIQRLLQLQLSSRKVMTL